MLKVGITGGIGSGKTTVCQLFEVLGIPVYYADQRAKELMITDKTLILKIKEHFGAEAYFADGSLNRKYIAASIFNDQKKLSLLNSLVHPAVFNDAQAWHQAQSGVPYTLREAALTFESGSYKTLDKVISIFAPEDLRIQRVMERDQSSREEVKARIAKQMPEIEKVKKADFVIINDGKHSLVAQVLNIHNILK